MPLSILFAAFVRLPRHNFTPAFPSQLSTRRILHPRRHSRAHRTAIARRRPATVASLLSRCCDTLEPRRRAARSGVFLQPHCRFRARRCQHGATTTARIQSGNLCRPGMREGRREGYVACSTLLPTLWAALTPLLPPLSRLPSNMTDLFYSNTTHNLLPSLLHLHIPSDARSARPHPARHRRCRPRDTHRATNHSIGPGDRQHTPAERSWATGSTILRKEAEEGLLLWPSRGGRVLGAVDAGRYACATTD